MKAKNFPRKCDHCGEKCYDHYMLEDSVWYSVNNSFYGIFHLECFEQLLGRNLRIEDFKIELPINSSIVFGYTMAKRLQPMGDGQ